MNQNQQEINQTLHQFQVLLNKALQQDSRTMFRLSVGKLLEVESLLSASEETLEQTTILTPTNETLVGDSNPESVSDNFKDSSDNISDVENKEENNEKDTNV